MKFTRTLAAFVVSALAAGTAGAAQVFFSTSPTAPTLSDPSVSIQLGQTQDVFVWVKPGPTDKLGGVSLSATATAANIATAVHTIDVPAGRWNGGTTAGTLTTPLFTNSNAFSLDFGGTTQAGAMGLLGTSDPLYNAASGAYRYSRLTLTGQTLGSTTVFLKVGNSQITNADGSFPTISFGSDAATVLGSASGQTAGAVADMTIVVTPVPEPGSIALIGMAILPLLRRSRR